MPKTPAAKPKPVFLSIPEVAARWGVSRFTVRREVQRGMLRAVRLGRRFRFHIQEVERRERGE
jgi:excisionase family DNA binding protein